MVRCYHTSKLPFSSIPPPPLSSKNQLSFRVLLYLLTLLPLALGVFALARSNVFAMDHIGGLPPYENTQAYQHGLLHSPTRLHNIGHNKEVDSDAKICITTTTSGGLDQILPWLFYHKFIGVSQFFLFVEGTAAEPKVSNVLASIPGVKLVFQTKELQERRAKSRIWNESWLSAFFDQPCNYDLFVRQSLNMEMAIVMAREARMDWIIHIDTDELLYPNKAKENSLKRLLDVIDDDVDTVIFPNYESAVERDDITQPFKEVTLFKRNYDHVDEDTYYALYDEATRGNPNYFLTYANGKSAARVQDHLRPNGAHRWHNYMKNPKEIKLEQGVVLHYTYAKFSDLTSRRDRCQCKPTEEDVERCFMLGFDREAFVVASTSSEEEMRQWYRERVVWTNKELNSKLMKYGILTRIYEPMLIIQRFMESNIFQDTLTYA